MFGFPNYSFPLYRNYNRYNRYSLNNPFMFSNIRRPVNSKNHNYQGKTQRTDNFNQNISSTNLLENSYRIEDSKEKEAKNSKKQKSSDNEFLEIFGIKLYFDDLMIISLLFFLYSEGVNDYYLFITLILLLLT